jgi:hypothetical protein
MSLPINPSEVVAVQLSDGWHLVKDGSFAVDAYAYVESYAGGETKVKGFRFVEHIDIGDSTVAGPLSAVQAVRLVS